MISPVENNTQLELKHSTKHSRKNCSKERKNIRAVAKQGQAQVRREREKERERQRGKNKHQIKSIHQMPARAGSGNGLPHRPERALHTCCCYPLSFCSGEQDITHSKEESERLEQNEKRAGTTATITNHMPKSTNKKMQTERQITSSSTNRSDKTKSNKP